MAGRSRKPDEARRPDAADARRAPLDPDDIEALQERAVEDSFPASDPSAVGSLVTGPMHEPEPRPGPPRKRAP